MSNETLENVDASTLSVTDDIEATVNTILDTEEKIYLELNEMETLEESPNMDEMSKEDHGLKSNVTQVMPEKVEDSEVITSKVKREDVMHENPLIPIRVVPKNPAILLSVVASAITNVP